MAITDYKITTKFHEKDWFHPQPHSGCDYALPLNTPIEAISDGVIMGISTNEILGNNIRFKTPHDEIIVYGHLSEFKTKVGDQIHKGDIVGLSGGMPNTIGGGKSTGPHLHISVYTNEGTLVDPIPYVLNKVENNNSSPFLFPMILIILLVILWKFRKFVFYGIVIFILLIILFIVS